MTATAPESPAAQMMSPTRGSVRWWAADLRLGVHLAVRTDAAGRLRLLLASLGIGLSVAVLLLCASVGPGLEGRQARADTLVPAAVDSAPPAGVALFQAHSSRQTYHGQLVSGVDVAALDPGAAPPPGLQSFPAPGELAVSPALAGLLSSREGDALRPRFPGPVTAILSDAGLTAPSELRFVRGVLPSASPEAPAYGPDDPAVTWTWGRSAAAASLPDAGLVPDHATDLIRAVVLLGAAVVLVPLLIFVSLMARLGSATRGRRTAALRGIGATGPQLSRILAAESLVGAIGGLVVGTLGFLAARQLSWIDIGGAGFFPSDLTPAPAPVLLIVLLVPMVATGAALLRTQRTLGDQGADTEVPAGPRRVRARWVYAAGVAALVLVQLVPARPLFGANDMVVALIVLSGTALLVVLAVPVLLPSVLTLATRLVPTRRPVWLLAARLLQSDNGAASRAVTTVSVVVAATVALLPVLTAVNLTLATGYHADQDPTRYRVQVDGASTGEVTSLTADLRAVAGVHSLTGGSYVWMTPDTGTGAQPPSSSEVFIADCPLIAATLGITDCRAGDVFRVLEYGRPDSIEGGDRLHPGEGSPTPDSSWTVPEGVVRDVDQVVSDGIFAPNLVVTPEALGASLDAVLPHSFAFFSVSADRVDALDDLRNAAAPFGARARVTSMTEWAADSGTIRVVTTLQTGLVLGGSILVFLAVTGLLVVAVEQLVARRRALTLTVAAGVPRSVIARSLLAESFVSGLIGAALGTAVGLLLAAYADTIMQPDQAAPLWAGPVAAVAGSAVLATVAVTAAILPALPVLTRMDRLRTT